MGNALPDLLPLAAPRVRLRLPVGTQRRDLTAMEGEIARGVELHLTADAAFHKRDAFAQATAHVKLLIAQAGFEGVRVRAFFLAHVLTEMALDAHLLRMRPELADWYYGHLEAADARAVTDWAQQATGRALPLLPQVLMRFGERQYLRHYATDAGVTEGVNRLCARARQEQFTGKNETRLVRLTGQVVGRMADYGSALLACEAG